MTSFRDTTKQASSRHAILVPGVVRLVIISVGLSAFFTGASADPVPEAMREVRPYPGLSIAMTRAVMANGIHGHDAEAIEIELNDGATEAKAFFQFDPSFSHNRTITCKRADGLWNCEEQVSR
ncbi:MAG: hypothetical protein ACU0GG_12510 [Paracoccaceae bacterium]